MSFHFFIKICHNMLFNNMATPFLCMLLMPISLQAETNAEEFPAEQIIAELKIANLACIRNFNFCNFQGEMAIYNLFFRSFRSANLFHKKGAKLKNDRLKMPKINMNLPHICNYFFCILKQLGDLQSLILSQYFCP